MFSVDQAGQDSMAQQKWSLKKTGQQIPESKGPFQLPQSLSFLPLMPLGEQLGANYGKSYENQEQLWEIICHALSFETFSGAGQGGTRLYFHRLGGESRKTGVQGQPGLHEILSQINKVKKKKTK